MDMKTLDRLAKQQEKMPQGLKAYEQAYYIASRGLYQQYQTHVISLEQAREEKQNVIANYKAGEEEWHYFTTLHTIHHQLMLLKQQGFDSVLEYEILEVLERLL